MRALRSIHCFACLLSLGPLTALAVASDMETGARPWQMVIQLDNDVIAGTDRGYTNGSRVAFLKEFDEAVVENPIARGLYKLSGTDPDGPLHGLRHRGDGPTRFAWGFGLTQLMFTPADPKAASAPNGERPYAGWLGLEFSLHVKDSASVSSVTLAVGTTGSNSYAGDTQTWMHENVSDSPTFEGWDSQVPNEVTVNLNFDQKLRMIFLDQSRHSPIGVDGYYEWGASVGNFRTDAYLGALMRFGWNLPSTFSTPRVQIGSYGHELFRSADPQRPPFSILGFIGVRGSAVLHDITLDGPVFRNFDTGVRSEPFVGEFLYGFGLRYRHAELAVSHTFRSDEFSGQDKNHEFGSVLLRFNLPF